MKGLHGSRKANLPDFRIPPYLLRIAGIPRQPASLVTARFGGVRLYPSIPTTLWRSFASRICIAALGVSWPLCRASICWHVLSWQSQHTAQIFAGFQKSASTPLCGMMWSATAGRIAVLASSDLPCLSRAPHIWQVNRSRVRTAWRRRCHRAVPYGPLSELPGIEVKEPFHRQARAHPRKVTSAPNRPILAIRRGRTENLNSVSSPIVRPVCWLRGISPQLWASAPFVRSQSSIRHSIAAQPQPRALNQKTPAGLPRAHGFDYV